MTLSANALITIDEYVRYTGADVPAGLRMSQWEDAVETASAWVEQHCGRQFHKTDPTDLTPSARYFEAHGDLVHITDLYSLTSIETDTGGTGTYSTTVSATYYQMLPQGGYDDLLGAVPYSTIKQLAYGIWPWLYTYRDGTTPVSYREKPIKVTGLWGWTAVPAVVKRATVVVAQELLTDPESNFGDVNVGLRVVAGSRVETRAEMMLNPYVRMLRAPGIQVA